MTDAPTVLSLYDTITVLNNRNPNWRDVEFLINIFIWVSAIFDKQHVIEVCNTKCPELMHLCMENSTHLKKTSLL